MAQKNQHETLVFPSIGDLAEHPLAHTIKDKDEATYHRTDILEQRRELMDARGSICA